MQFESSIGLRTDSQIKLPSDAVMGLSLLGSLLFGDVY